MLQLHLSDQQFYCLRCHLYQRFDGICGSQITNGGNYHNLRNYWKWSDLNFPAALEIGKQQYLTYRKIEFSVHMGSTFRTGHSRNICPELYIYDGYLSSCLRNMLCCLVYILNCSPFSQTVSELRRHGGVKQAGNDHGISVKCWSFAVKLGLAYRICTQLHTSCLACKQPITAKVISHWSLGDLK